MQLSDIVRIVGGETAYRFSPCSDPIVNSFATTRGQVKPGSAFFALSQPDYANNCFNNDFGDTNLLIPSAFFLGARVCFTRRDSYERHKSVLEPYFSCLVFVPDAIVAIQSLARFVYNNSRLPLIGVTGSAGKTTTKELIRSMFELAGKKVLATSGNMNNGIGVPLSILELADGATRDVAVIEMGMSTPKNEIARLCSICAPDISVILNILPVHMQHLGSMEAIARAKIQIVEHMEPTGIAVLNGDDEILRKNIKVDSRVIWFGQGEDSDVRATKVECTGNGISAVINTMSASFEVNSPLIGSHNITSILAAISVCHAMRIESSFMELAIEKFYAAPQRGALSWLPNDVLVIDESYNSNPASLEVAVRAAQLVSRGKRLILVIGEMFELGAQSAQLHFDAGRSLASSGAELIVGVGTGARVLLYGVQSCAFENIHFSSTAVDAGNFLVSRVRPHDVIFVKGSRGCKLERLIEILSFGLSSHIR